MSELVLGTVQLGLNYGIANKQGKPDILKAKEIVSEAVNQNIVYFDTAQTYGDSEIVLGICFSKLNKSKIKVINKLDPNIDIADRKSVIDSIQKSLKNLRIDSLFGLLLHRPIDFKDWEKRGDKVVKELKKESLIQNFGISMAYSLDEIIEAAKQTNIDIVQIPMNIWDRRAIEAGILTLLKSKKIRIFIRSVFLQGLAFLNEKDIPNNLSFLYSLVNDARNFCNNRGFSVPHFCIQYVINKCPDEYIVFGAENKEQIIDNINYINNEISVDNFIEWEKKFKYIDEK